MKKIKLIHIIGRLSYGGAERLLLDLTRKIDKSQFEVSVLSLQGGGRLVEKFEEAGIPVKIMRKRFKGDFRVILEAKKYLLEEKPDVVHTHLFVGDFFGGVAAKLAKVSVIVSTKHDILSEGFIRDFLGKTIRKKFDRVIAISKATRDYLVKKQKLKIEKVPIIYNGIDVAKFYVEDPKLFESKTLHVGAVGRLSKEKGHKHLIRACRFLKTKEWELRLVGDGPLRKDLEKDAQMLDVEDKVTFVGTVSNVKEELEKMDVFVLPSVSEGLSLAVIEAALAGRFVIATKVGGVPEIIENEKTGLLFRPKNIEELVAKLNWVSDHQEQAAKMAKNLQQDVRERFDINKIINDYEKLYLELLG